MSWSDLHGPQHVTCLAYVGWGDDTNPNVHSNVDVGFSLTSVCLSPKRALINSNPKAMIQWLLEQSSSTISCLQGPLARPKLSWFSSGMTCVKVYSHWIVFMVQPARAQAKTTRPVLTTSNTPRQHGKTFMCPSQKKGCKRYVLLPINVATKVFCSQKADGFNQKSLWEDRFGDFSSKRPGISQWQSWIATKIEEFQLLYQELHFFRHKHLPKNLDCQFGLQILAGLVEASPTF